MKIKFILVFLFITILTGYARQTESPKLSGAYLGQDLPGLIPQIFAKDIISTEKSELNCVFTPDGNEFYYTLRKDGLNTIMTMKKKGELWTEPTVAFFSGKFSDVDPYITSDGNRLYFSSKRPLKETGDPKDSDLWYIEKNNSNWGQPVRLTEPNSIGKDDYYTSISDQGTLYFSVFAEHGSPGNICFSKNINGKFTQSEILASPINTKFNEHDPFIAPDESYLIFTSNRVGGFGKGDLYICFKQSDGTWSDPTNMGANVNTESYDYAAMLTHDGKYLFFTRYANGNGDIYWVDAKIIENLKKQY